MDTNNYYYKLSSSTTLSNNHPSYKIGYKYSCLYKDTDPNANLKFMDFYYKEKCPKTRNY